MKPRTWSVLALVLGMAAGLLAFGGGHPGGRPDGPPPGSLRDSMHQRRTAPKPLTGEQKEFLSRERALRDSMDQAIRSYAESVRKGSDARAMVSDRAIINDYARRLERFRQENLDVWLDVLALRPLHDGLRGKRPPPDMDTLPPLSPEDSLPAKP